MRATSSVASVTGKFMSAPNEIQPVRSSSQPALFTEADFPQAFQQIGPHCIFGEGQDKV
jgi:hypothetical protein